MLQFQLPVGLSEYNSGQPKYCSCCMVPGVKSSSGWVQPQELEHVLSFTGSQNWNVLYQPVGMCTAVCCADRLLLAGAYALTVLRATNPLAV